MHATPESTSARYRIGDLVLDTAQRRVTRNGKSLKVGGLTFDMLEALAESSPGILHHEELAERVWRGRPVSPETVTQRAKMLRDALSDDAKAPRYVEPVRGQGYRLVTAAERLPDREEETSRGRDSRVVLLAVVAVALLIVVLLELRAPVPAKPASVAVLPLADMSQSGDQQYLADGFAEELINQLARLDGLEVASRTESFYLHGTTGDLQAIGRQLDVSAVLEGSIRRSANEIRLTVQLIDVDSGYHLWSQEFERELEDIFAIQEEIARAVAGALGVKLGVGTVNEFPGAGTRNFEAYEAFLRQDYAKAMELDPGYAAAWGAEGIRIASTMWFDLPEAAPAIVERSYPYVAEAVALDPNSSQAHANFATLIYATLDWKQAEESFARSLSLDRNEYNLAHYANMQMRAGRTRMAESLRLERQALLHLPEIQTSLKINIDIAQGRLDTARQKIRDMKDEAGRFLAITVALNGGTTDEVRAAIDRLPGASTDYIELYQPVRDLLDSPDDALAFLKALESDPNRDWPYKNHNIALLAAFLGDAEFALEAISRELPHTTVRYGALWYPVMGDARKLPAFKTLMEEVNLVDYWRSYGWSDYCRPYGEDDFVCD